jgi:hypothetical protein
MTSTTKPMFALDRVPMPEFQFELYDAAWGSLNEREQKWLGRPDFDALCAAVAEGEKERNLHKVIGLSRKSFNEFGQYPKQKLALTNWFKGVFKRRPIVEYVRAMQDDEIPPWTDVVRELRSNSQQIIRDRLQAAVDDKNADKETIALAKWIAEYEMGKPESRSRHTLDASDNATAAIDRASDRVADSLSRLAVSGGRTVVTVDSKDHPVGDGE